MYDHVYVTLYVRVTGMQRVPGAVCHWYLLRARGDRLCPSQRVAAGGRVDGGAGTGDGECAAVHSALHSW